MHRDIFCALVAHFSELLILNIVILWLCRFPAGVRFRIDGQAYKGGFADTLRRPSWFCPHPSRRNSRRACVYQFYINAGRRTCLSSLASTCRSCWIFAVFFIVAEQWTACFQTLRFLKWAIIHYYLWHNFCVTRVAHIFQFDAVCLNFQILGLSRTLSISQSDFAISSASTKDLLF